MILIVHKTDLVECRAVIDFLDTYSSSNNNDPYRS